MIKQKYRERYEDGSCGDVLARKLRKHLEAEGGTIDLAKLQQLAERNGVWVSRYASLNPGMARMVVANRLRRLVRAGSVDRLELTAMPSNGQNANSTGHQGLAREGLRQREAERWITACKGLRTAVVKIDLLDEPGWWERPIP